MAKYVRRGHESVRPFPILPLGRLRRADIRWIESIPLEDSETCISFGHLTADQNRLVLSDGAGTVCSIDLAGDRIPKVWRDGTTVLAAQGSDGLRVVTYGQRGASIRDAATGTVQRVLTDQGVRISGFRPDGKYLLVDRHAAWMVYSTVTWELIRRIAWPPAFSPPLSIG